MAPFGPYYPLVLDVIMRHTERLHELLVLRERLLKPGDAGYDWLKGRPAELRCAAAILARDWHDGRLSAEMAAVELARYIKDAHDGLERNLGIRSPSCCRLGFAHSDLADGAR